MIARLLPAAALLASVATVAWAQSPPAAPAASAPAATAPAAAAPAAAAPAASPPAVAVPALRPPAAAAAATPAKPPPMSKATEAAVDQRIKALQTELGITAAQSELWQAFAQSMRDSAAATEALFERRAGAAAAMNAVENMRSYADIARAYADNMERLATEFANLYASLSDLQRRAADTLFRKQMVAAAQTK